jgi:hypothetical protein
MQIAKTANLQNHQQNAGISVRVAGGRSGIAFACCNPRVEEMDRSSHPSRDEFSSLISEGLILWRLAMPGRSDLWGLAFELPDGLFFVVDDNPEGPRPYKVHERHESVVTLVDRSDELRQSLCKCGWFEVDVD